ncbi:WXG100 family type VII secretion target [Actinomyces graevenitzii]|uniref:WXG100 family type VII secretion target n=1 Tax=Actinomyces graevenitzii TaxID=55565 RepID=UPI000402C5F7|nr:WXG100 family type VII secretion target [Actinomyces graevenitzii]
MASVGADVEQLSALAQLFGDKATSLEDVVNSINGQLHSAGWVGEDADAFKSDWDSNLTVLVRNVVDSLRERNTSLNQQADEQEKASAVNGSISGAKGVGSIAKSGSGGSGSDPYNGKPREGEAGRDADYARLAQAAYEKGDPIPDGWRKISDDELAELGIDPSELDTKYGMQATVYQNADGKYVLAFRGTELDREPGKDLGNDIAGGAFTSFQVNEAINVSTKLAKAVGPENLDFTGHSLGGELASVAAIATGGQAVTFNAAGVSTTSETIARGSCLTNFGTQSPMDGSNVKAYSYAYDPVNGGQDMAHDSTLLGYADLIAPRAYGERHIISASEGASPSDGIKYNHNVERMYGALDAQYENPSANRIAASGTPTASVAAGYVLDGYVNGLGEVGNGYANAGSDITSGANDAAQHLTTSGMRVAGAWSQGDYAGAVTEGIAGTAQAAGDVAAGVAKGAGDVLVGAARGYGEVAHGVKKALVGGE